MPSYHEGLPIALLEAMSYNLDVLVSNIPANLEVNLVKDNYFEVSNIKELAFKINSAISIPKNNNDYSYKIKNDYNWDKITMKITSVYKEMNCS